MFIRQAVAVITSPIIAIPAIITLILMHIGKLFSWFERKFGTNKKGQTYSMNSSGQLAQQYYYRSAKTGESTGTTSGKALSINAVVDLKVPEGVTHIEKQNMKKIASEVFKNSLEESFGFLKYDTVGVR